MAARAAAPRLAGRTRVLEEGARELVLAGLVVDDPEPEARADVAAGAVLLNSARAASTSGAAPSCPRRSTAPWPRQRPASRHAGSK